MVGKSQCQSVCFLIYCMLFCLFLIFKCSQPMWYLDAKPITTSLHSPWVCNTGKKRHTLKRKPKQHAASLSVGTQSVLQSLAMMFDVTSIFYLFLIVTAHAILHSRGIHPTPAKNSAIPSSANPNSAWRRPSVGAHSPRRASLHPPSTRTLPLTAQGRHISRASMACLRYRSRTRSQCRQQELFKGEKCKQPFSGVR